MPDDPYYHPDLALVHHLGFGFHADDCALVAGGEALRPNGVFAIDLCDLSWTEGRADQHARGWETETWALVTETSVPKPDRYVRQMAIFSRNHDGTWRRDDERHVNVMVD